MMLAQAPAFDLNVEIDARDPDAVALLVYTSGTTGPPRARNAGRNIISSGKAATQMFGPQMGKRSSAFCLAHIWERTNALYLPLFQKPSSASPKALDDL